MCLSIPVFLQEGFGNGCSLGVEVLNCFLCSADSPRDWGAGRDVLCNPVRERGVNGGRERGKEEQYLSVRAEMGLLAIRGL